MQQTDSWNGQDVKQEFLQEHFVPISNILRGIIPSAKIFFELVVYINTSKYVLLKLILQTEESEM